MVSIKGGFLRPSLQYFDESKEDSICDSKEFYWSAFNHSLYITFVGFVFILVLFSQIMSLEQLPQRITNITWKSFFGSIGVSLLFTMAVKWTINAEQISSRVGGSKYEEMNYDMGDISLNSGMYIFTSFGSTSFMFLMSELLATGVPSLLEAMSEGNVLEFILVLLLYIILAGVVGTLVSSLFLLRYELLPVTRGARSWARRLRFYLSIVPNEGSEGLEEALKGRCPHCCSRKLVSETTDDRVICQVCGSYRGIHRPESRPENDESSLSPQQQD